MSILDIFDCFNTTFFFFITTFSYDKRNYYHYYSNDICSEKKILIYNRTCCYGRGSMCFYNNYTN